MSKYIKGDYTAVVEHSMKTCAINLYIQNTKLGCGLIIPRSTKVGTEYHTTTHSNLFGATTETDKRGIYDEQKIFDELTELGKNIVDFMVFCAGYEKPFIDEAKICKAVELPETKLMDYNPVNVQVEKKLKALEIIKEKRVNIGTFYHVVFILKASYDGCKANNKNILYNICDVKKEFLTEEEFDLLKEVLE